MALFGNNAISDLEWAKLTPEQKSSVNISGLTRQAVQGVGSLFGLKTPEQQQREMMGQFDMTTVEGLRQAASALQRAGDFQNAMALAAKADEMVLQQQKIANERAQAEYNKARASAAGVAKDKSTAQERIAAEIGDLETKAMNNEEITISDLNKARMLLSQAAKPSRRFNTDTGTWDLVPGLKPQDLAPALWAKIQGQQTSGAVPAQIPGQQAAGVAQQSIQPAYSQDPYATSVATPQAEKIKKTEIAAAENNLRAIEGDLRNVDQAFKLMNMGGIFDTTGPSGAITRFFDVFGTTDAAALADKISSINASKVFTQLQELRAASKSGASGLGQVTENEIKLLQDRMSSLNPNNKAQFKTELSYIKNKWTELRKRAANDIAYLKGEPLPYENVGSIIAPAVDFNPTTKTVDGKRLDQLTTEELAAAIKAKQQQGR